MLSSKLYTDPVRAMVRETVSNALDAGGSTPVEITLDYSQDGLCVYSVKDSGSGMSPHCVSDVLTKLGESTKSNDNNAHGGYGIGILSVFAAAEQAKIETISDGICYHYLLCKNSEGVPELNLLHQCEDTLGAGTTISVAIPNHLNRELISAINWIATLCKTKILLFEVNEHGYRQAFGHQKFFAAGELYEFLELYKHKIAESDVPLDFVDPCLVVRVGDIPYRISKDQMIWISREAKSRNLDDGVITLVNRIAKATIDFAGKDARSIICPETSNRFFCLNIGIGQLDLPGSREELICDHRNNDIIAKALVSSILDIQSSYRKKFLETSEDVSLSFKLKVVQSFGLKSFSYRGCIYQLQDFWRSFGFWSFSSSLKFSLTSTYLYHRFTDRSPRKTVVLIGSREHHHARIVTTLVENTPELDEYLNKLSELLFVRYQTNEDYELDIQSDPVLALALSGAVVIVDPGPRRRSTKDSELLEQEKDRRKRVRSTNYLRKNPVRRLNSLAELGVYRQANSHVPMLLEDIAGENALFSPSNKVPLINQEESIVYLEVGRSNGLHDLMVFAHICNEMGWDTPVYFIPKELLESLRVIVDRERIIKVEDYMDDLVQSWLSERLPLIKRIGFFPGLNIRDEKDLSTWLSAISISKDGAVPRKIERILLDDSVEQVADPRRLYDLTIYLQDFAFWRLIVESSYSLRLFRTCLVFESAIHASDIAFTLDRDLSKTVEYLLEPILRQIPLFAFMRISLDQVPIDQFLLSVKSLVEKYDPNHNE
jgi:hypothetical protein